ncbi:MAG: hypothetical protein AB7F28_02730 [Candidatus Margulisiibacteriota bacterium]
MQHGKIIGFILCIAVLALTRSIYGYPMSGYLVYGGYIEFNLSEERNQINSFLADKYADKKLHFLREEVIGTTLLYRQSNASKEWFMMYDFKTKKETPIPSASWYFSDKKWLFTGQGRFNDEAPHKDFDGKIGKGRFECSYWIYALDDQQMHLALPTDNNAFQGIKPLDPVCSYNGAYIYYIDRAGNLVERNIENIDKPHNKILYDLSDFLNSRASARYFELSPPSPNRKYIAIQAESELYLIDLEAKTMRHIAGKTFGFFGGGVEGPFYWDKDSKYLLFGANFDWIAWVYDHDVYYYDIEQKSIHQIKTGDRLNGNFGYRWE